MEAAGPQLRIFIDADACPVKDEVYRVAARYGLTVFVVANSAILIPRTPEIEQVVVGPGPDAADNWIAERAGPGAIVVTADIPLANRCVKSGADVIAPNGKRFSESSIGMALATRNLMDQLRSTGQATLGPRPSAHATVQISSVRSITPSRGRSVWPANLVAPINLRLRHHRSARPVRQRRRRLPDHASPLGRVGRGARIGETRAAELGQAC